MPCICCHRGKLRRTQMCGNCIATVAMELKAHYAKLTVTQPATITSKQPAYPHDEYKGPPAF